MCISNTIIKRFCFGCKRASVILSLMLFVWQPSTGQYQPPLRLGIVRLTHAHVHQVLKYPKDKEITIVGIVEPDTALARRYSNWHGFAMDIVFPTIEEMLIKTRPEAVAAYGSIYEHLEVVENCAPEGIHVMVEKPLAVNMEHASKMAELANKYNIHLITNYETTWYPTNHEALNLMREPSFGPVRKIVVNTGHFGPVELGLNKEFLSWLTDPVMNGGGALIDFGCYGANLATWLFDGEMPISVTAVCQTNKPEIYPDVEDEATVILHYPGKQVVIQASWNWPVNRKDMQIYGQYGQIKVINSNELVYRENKDSKDQIITMVTDSTTFGNPFAYFEALVHNKIKPATQDLSSLENNLKVIRILDAARQSAESGKTIYLNN